MIKILFTFLLGLFCFESIAQQRVEEVQKVLVEEFNKAGHQVKFASSPSQSGIYLELVDGKKSGKYQLNNLTEEGFYIKSNESSIHIASTSVDGLKNGAWWYLNYLGFRYFFPAQEWHYIPEINSIYKKIERTVYPSFTYRRIWYAYGTGSVKATQDYNKWFEANLLGGREIKAGHSYDGIVHRNKEVFLKHPEYFAQKVVKGVIPVNPKFEVANEDLVQLVIKDSRKQIEDHIKKTGKAPEMISLDPSDAGGFSTSASSTKIGGPSEQVFYLANRVSKALRASYPSLRIGLYAYNYHAAPPRFEIEPNITVLIATAMNQSKFRTDELIALWRKKGVEVGLRDYYGVMAWDWDMPGQPSGSRFNYVTQLKNHYKNGIRVFSAETNVGWISRGPAHYLASRLLWDVNTDVEHVMNEFYHLMFGKAAPQIKQLYDQWSVYPHKVPLDGDLFNWMQLVDKASKLETNKFVQERFSQIKQYLHYVVLYKRWKEQPTDKNLINMFSYAYRVQDKGIVASYPLFRRLASSYVAGKPNMNFKDPNAVWKKDTRPLTEFETGKNFSTNLSLLNRDDVTVNVKYPSTFSSGKAAGKGNESGLLMFRGRHRMIVQVNDPPRSALRIRVGLIKATSYKDLRLSIYPYVSTLELKDKVYEQKITPGKTLNHISLSFLKPGIYLFEFDDARSGFQMGFDGDMRYGIISDDQSGAQTFARNNIVFDVQPGIKKFTVVNKNTMSLLSPAGRVITVPKNQNITEVEIKKGETGIWAIRNLSGQITLKGVLPLFSDSEAFLIRTNE